MEEKRVYTAIVWKAEEGGFWAEVAELPGCFSQGESKPELLDNIKAAIETYLDGAAETDSAYPQGKPEFAKVEMPARLPAGAAD